MDWQIPVLTMNIAYQNRVRLPAKNSRVFQIFWSSVFARILKREFGWTLGA